jgi:hypothetical protein
MLMTGQGLHLWYSSFDGEDFKASFIALAGLPPA